MSSVLKINNSYVDDIISSQFAVSSLLKEDLVIAGGFPLAVYNAYERQKPEYLDLLLRQIRAAKKAKYSPLCYSDIDFWPTNDLNNPTVASLFAEKPVNDVIIDNKIIVFSKKSRWANTGYIRNLRMENDESNKHDYSSSYYPIQFIKKPVNSPEDLISSFDLNICKVAYYKGCLYVDEASRDDMRSSSLTMNSDYKRLDDNFSNKIFLCNRYIKYAKRYSLDLSSDLCEYIFTTFFESSNQEVLSEFVNVKTPTPLTVSVSNYGATNKLDKLSFYKSLINDETYYWFSKQKSFQPDWHLFLIDHPHIPVVKRIIEGSDPKLLF